MNPDLSNAVTAAPALLGYKLIHESPEGMTEGYIVETEAYTFDDPASHSYRGESLRNQAMFQRAGTIYVYFTYGMHYCVNIVTGDRGQGQAVLIRALEPITGLGLMKQRRATSNLKILTNGPAKLTQAMGINREHNGMHLSEGPLKLITGIKPVEIIQTTRVGITKSVEAPLRFYIADNPYVSHH